MFEFHKDRKRYFEIQLLNAETYVIPFIDKVFPILAEMRVLEIGCGEGGVLKAFLNKGCSGVGVELEAGRVENGKLWLQEDIVSGKLSFLIKDIYSVTEKELGNFDIIVLKDVIEHIHDQAKLIRQLKNFPTPTGVIFFGFPPWQMPFGGHQQMCRIKKLSKVPYFHLLPTFLYKKILKAFNEPIINDLLEIKQTGISIEKFERIVKRENYKIIAKLHYLINPIYQWKFGWQPKIQYSVISRMPVLRNFFTTCVFYLITP